MYIEQFVYLKAISQTGSLRAASEQVFVTEQAMSSAIRKLEKECGVSLLRRSNKGVSLTEHGQYVLEKRMLFYNLSKTSRNIFRRGQNLRSRCM